MKSFLRKQWFPLLLLMISVVMAIAFYPVLPERMAIHWGVCGNPDVFATKSLFTVSLGPLTILVFYLLFSVIPKIDPRRENIMKFKQYNLLRNMLLILFLFFEYLTLRTAVSTQQKLAVFYVIFGIGLLLVFIGNYLPKMSSSFFVGIRTPWTLSSEEVWKRTHRVGGKLFVLMGIMFMLGSFLPSHVLWLLFLPLIILILFITIYSYHLSKRLGKQMENKLT